MSVAVSIIIVSQRRPDDLERTLASLIYQSVQNYELIVVADRPPRISKFLKIPMRFIEFQEANISKARNTGILAANAPIIAFIDDDAVPDPFWLERLVQPFYDNKNIVATGGFVRGRNGISYQWKGIGFTKNAADFPLSIADDEPYKICKANSEFYYKCIGTNCAYRRDALHEIGGFDQGFHYYLDDTDVCKRLQDLQYPIAIVPNAQLIHFYRPSRGRNSARVPQSLYNLGASTNLYLRKHDPDHLVENLDQFFQDQQQRLRDFFMLGLIRPKQIKALLRDLDNGLQTGSVRQSITPLAGINTQEPIPLTTISPRFELKSKRTKTPDPTNIIVKLKTSYTSRSAHLRFRREGHWQFQGGQYGRIERKGRWWRFRTRKNYKKAAYQFLLPNFTQKDSLDRDETIHNS